MSRYKQDLTAWQKQYFTQVLAEHGGRTVLAAEALGMNRTHFIKNLNKLGIRVGNRGNDAWRALGV